MQLDDRGSHSRPNRRGIWMMKGTLVIRGSVRTTANWPSEPSNVTCAFLLFHMSFRSNLPTGDWKNRSYFIISFFSRLIHIWLDWIDLHFITAPVVSTPITDCISVGRPNRSRSIVLPNALISERPLYKNRWRKPNKKESSKSSSELKRLANMNNVESGRAWKSSIIIKPSLMSLLLFIFFISYFILKETRRPSAKYSKKCCRWRFNQPMRYWNDWKQHW